MIFEDFIEKYPDVTVDSFKEDEIYGGYPCVKYTFDVSCTWGFDVWSCTFEHCLDIADKILEKVSDLNFNSNDEYLKRYDEECEKFFKARKGD